MPLHFTQRILRSSSFLNSFYSYAVICFLLISVTIVKAQSYNGSMAGKVSDQTGAALSGADVTIINEGTNFELKFATNENGNFFIPRIPIGSYTITITYRGLANFIRQNIPVDVSTEVVIDAKLKVEANNDLIIVTDKMPVLKRESGMFAEMIDNRQLEALPMNGRDFRKLITLTPGAAPRSQRGSLGSLTVNGQREKSNIFLIDGVDNNDPFRNQSSFNQGGVTNAPATLIPVDAIAEFSIQVQGSAEYGRNSGAVLNSVIKSGTNNFHGAIYDFLRNDALDARNFFETLPGSRKGEFKNNNFGGVLGGPIFKDRLFFFMGYEGQRERASSPSAIVVPGAIDIANARNINSNAGRRENLLSTRLLNLFPTENNIGSPNNYVFSSSNSNNSNNFLVRIDNRINSRFTLNGRYIFGDGDQIFPLTSNFGSPLPEYQTTTATRVQLGGLDLTHIISPNLINEIRFSYTRFRQDFNPLDRDFDPASLGLITGAKSLPTITIQGFNSLGAPTNIPRGRISSAFQFNDTFSLIKNSHVYKFGLDYRRAIVNSFNDLFARGRINFNNLSDFLAGLPAVDGTTISRGSTRRDTFTNNYALFYQDDWKISNHLMISAGLRYEYIGSINEEHNRLSNFIPNIGLLQVGSSALPEIYQPDRNNISPRLGFSYDIQGKGKLVLRGGYGLYYDAPSQDYFLAQGFAASSIGTNPIGDLGVDRVIFNPNTKIPFGPNIDIFSNNGRLNAPQSLLAIDHNLRTPYIQNYNISLQYAISDGSVFQLAYIGSQGRKLYRLRDINQATPGDPATRQQRRPFNTQFPQFSSINYLETTANSNYNSLQLFYRQRLSKGLTLFFSYTLSKSIDDASNGIFAGTPGVSFPQDSNNLKAERALSIFDARHRLATNFVYDLKFLSNLFPRMPKALTEGWQISGIYVFATGSPITPFLGTDISGTGNLNDRPNVIADPNAGDKTFNRAFNKGAFTLPIAGTFGSAGRNTIIGPNFNVGDLSILKATKLKENLSLQLRIDIFNIFNKKNFSLPEVQFDSRSFGTFAQTPDTAAGNPKLGEGGPREIQFGLKFIF